MKIFSSKKWEKIAQQIVDYQMDLNQSKVDNQTYLEQVNYLIKVKEDNAKSITNLENELMSKKLELKNLKTYCTKNKFDYSILYKKEVK